MTIVSHPTGNQFVRALLAGLESRGMLERFFTTVNAPGEKILRCLPRSLREQLSRRAFDLPRRKITTRPLRELARLCAPALGVKSSAGMESVDAVYRDLDKAVAAWLRKRRGRAPGIVHCYEDGAEQTFLAAAAVGSRRVYELPIAYWETVHKILGEEAERLPMWKATLFATDDGREKLERKTRELELADAVVCPSQFVYDSLPGHIRKTKRCVVAKFGSPQSPPQSHEPRHNKKLRLLFAGAMTQRKGLADVFAAMKLLRRNDVELVVMGSPILPMNFYREQYADFTHEPPRAHHAVMELMQACDALALPSLVEGRALVQQEALACGLPLIVTANAGGADLVEEGITGFLVPVRSPAEIAEKIEWLAAHREMLPRMGAAARAKAAGCRWEDYCETIIKAGGAEE